MAKKKAAPASPQKKAQQQLRTFTQKGPGAKVSTKEIKRVAPKQGVDPKKILQKAKSDKKVKLSGGARKYLRGLLPKNADPGATDDVLSGGSSSVWQDEGTGVFGPISQHEKDIANIYADADKYIADAEVRGIDISSGRQLEGVKYASDKESEWRQSVANIEVKGRLDLQPIINAGLEKVAGIEAQAQRDVADITGKYDVEGIRVRGEADKQIGGMQLAGNMYNLINAAFG
jgi:hypothetical protein